MNEDRVCDENYERKFNRKELINEDGEWEATIYEEVEQ
jgi:hypothetical protein